MLKLNMKEKYEVVLTDFYGPFWPMWERKKKIMNAISFIDTLENFEKKIKEACPEAEVRLEVYRFTIVIFFDNPRGVIYLTVFPFDDQDVLI
ncbi:MAG: hypothetical protein QW328_08720 [Nitrososphaerota archaeon]